MQSASLPYAPNQREHTASSLPPCHTCYLQTGTANVKTDAHFGSVLSVNNTRITSQEGGLLSVIVTD